jgi:TM2 domain-containing membrane protein YozV
MARRRTFQPAPTSVTAHLTGGTMTQPSYGGPPEQVPPPAQYQAPYQAPYQPQAQNAPQYPATPPHAAYPQQYPQYQQPPVAPYPGGQHPVIPVQYKDSTAAWLLWFFTGAFGGHHFYLGRTQRGVVYAVTWAVSLLLSFVVIGLVGFVVLFILWIIDATQLAEQVRQYNWRAHATNQSMGYA